MSSRSESRVEDRKSEPRDWRRLGAARSLEEFSAAWLAVSGAALGAARGVLVARRAGEERFSPVAFLPEGQPCGTFLADAAERALFEARPLAIEDDGRLAVAYPVELEGRTAAVAAFEWSGAPALPPEQLLRLVQWGIGWIEAHLRRAGGAAVDARQPAVTAALLKVLEARSFPDAARAAATELAHIFDCERVAVGVLRGGEVSVVAISHTAQFDARMALPRDLAAAMGEAARAGGTLLDSAEAFPGGALGRLMAEHGTASALCTVAGATAFCLERRLPFDESARPAIVAACALLAPALALQQAHGAPLLERGARSARARVEHWFGAAAGARRVVAVAILAALAYLAFAEHEFRVAGDAALEGAVRRVLTAPFDGYVAASHARAGDVVKEGAPIAALDDRDLRLERVRWASQHAQYARQMQEASARHERGQVQVLQAQLAQAAAQMQLLDEQLKRALLAAPFDGLVVSGDLSQSVGGAVRKGDSLFEVAPLARYRVVVHVEEGEIAAVAAGQKGLLLLAAITERSFPIAVTAVTPVAGVKDGRNMFRVEASLESDDLARLRPGMEGVAKIETGQRSLVWIWTHRMANWARLQLWRLLP